MYYYGDVNNKVDCWNSLH